MKHLFVVSLIVTGSFSAFGQASGPSGAASPAKAADKASVSQTLMQMERDWGQAEMKKDFAAIEKIIANDWVGIDYDGQIVPRAAMLEDMKSGKSTLQSESLSEMKVRVYGNTAVVTGRDSEKSMDRGKDSSGNYVFTDVFVMRNGAWRVVASQSTKVP